MFLQSTPRPICRFQPWMLSSPLPFIKPSVPIIFISISIIIYMYIHININHSDILCEFIYNVNDFKIMYIIRKGIINKISLMDERNPQNTTLFTQFRPIQPSNYPIPDGLVSSIVSTKHLTLIFTSNLFEYSQYLLCMH